MTLDEITAQIDALCDKIDDRMDDVLREFRATERELRKRIERLEDADRDARPQTDHTKMRA